MGREMREQDTDTIASTPPGRVRAIIGGLIALYLLWQVVLPVTYYLGDDVNDERFSWRMFSATWQSHGMCTVSVMEIESVPVPGAGNTLVSRSLDLERTLHRGWTMLLDANRRLVVEKFLQTRCRDNPRVAEVQYDRHCPNAAYSRIPSETRRLTCGPRAASPRLP
jgi:hypothetical protein